VIIDNTGNIISYTKSISRTIMILCSISLNDYITIENGYIYLGVWILTGYILESI
jgi:hypothetical protein